MSRVSFLAREKIAHCALSQVRKILPMLPRDHKHPVVSPMVTYEPTLKRGDGATVTGQAGTKYGRIEVEKRLDDKSIARGFRGAR